MDKDEKYLGNRLSLKRNRHLGFESLTNKIKIRISSWQPLVSQAGRNTLIKSVASAIPVYNVCFAPPYY